MIGPDILNFENYFFDDNIIISKAECTIFCSMPWYCRVSFIPFWSCTIAIIPWPPSVLLAFSPAVCPPHHQHFFQSPHLTSPQTPHHQHFFQSTSDLFLLLRPPLQTSAITLHPLNSGKLCLLYSIQVPKMT